MVQLSIAEVSQPIFALYFEIAPRHRSNCGTATQAIGVQYPRFFLGHYFPVTLAGARQCSCPGNRNNPAFESANLRYDLEYPAILERHKLLDSGLAKALLTRILTGPTGTVAARGLCGSLITRFRHSKPLVVPISLRLVKGEGRAWRRPCN